MTVRETFATAGIFAVFALSAPAEAAIKAASCPTLAAFGQELDLKQVQPVNKAGSRITLPVLMAGPRVQEVFGSPALAWTPEDVAVAVKATGDCLNEAKKAKKTPDIQALTNTWQGLGVLKAALGGIAVVDQRVDQWLKVVVESPPARPVLVVLTQLLNARTGTAEALAGIEKGFKDYSVKAGGWFPIHTQATNLIGQLRDAPSAAWDHVFPPIEKRIAEVKDWALQDVAAAINAAPETPEGLRATAAALAKAKLELAGGLSDVELAGFDKIAADRRNAIEEALAGKELTTINGLPKTAEALNLLRTAAASPVKAALSPPRVAALDARIVERRDEIGAAVADEQIKRLDQFPATLVGLREVDKFSTDTGRGLEALAGAATAQRFREAATRRATAIGQASLDTFRKAAAEMPATDQGLAEFDKAFAEIRGPIGTLDASVRSAYLDTATKRREEIVAAVAKEDERLARLPLEGAVFADPSIGAKFEFRNKTSVYVTMLQDQTIEAGYEVDGDRVIIQTPRGNEVFTRQGPWISGGGLKLKRQAAK